MLPDKKSEDEKEEQRKRQAQDLAASSIGIQFVLTVVLGAFLGMWLDKKFGTTPWLTLILILLGLFAGMWNAYQVAVKQDKKDSDLKDRKSK